MRGSKTQIGDRFGLWEVIDTALPISSRNRTRWLCRCDCGVTRIVTQATLRAGSSNGCGCARYEKGRQQLAIHGQFGHPLYGTWTGMKSRVRNPNNSDYPNYGGRGIKICERWEWFPNFIQDMGPRPSPEHSLHRLNNDGNYSPDNCVWATPKEQARNQSSTRWLEVNGDRRSLAEFAELYAMDGRVLGRRIDRSGWSVLEALTIPVSNQTGHIQAMRRSGEIVSCL